MPVVGLGDELRGEPVLEPVVVFVGFDNERIREMLVGDPARDERPDLDVGRRTHDSVANKSGGSGPAVADVAGCARRSAEPGPGDLW